MKVLHKHNFIGHSTANIVQTYAGSDSIENLSMNLEKMPKDWYYKTNDITYSFNSFGHRSKELACLDIDNYILFTGCSNTLGVGLELLKTYPNLVSKQSGYDYYNLAVGGSGIDALLHNLIIWRSVVTKLPKFLIIQWPERNRYLKMSDPDSNILTTNGIWNKKVEIKNFIIAGEDVGFFQSRKNLASKIIESIFNCPTIQISIAQDYEIGNNIIKFPKIDFARDIIHPGILSNLLFSTRICKEIANMNQ